MHREISTVLENTQYFDIPKLVSKFLGRTFLLYELTKRIPEDNFVWEHENVQMYNKINFNTTSKSCILIHDKFSSFLSAGIQQNCSFTVEGGSYATSIMDVRHQRREESIVDSIVLSDRDISTVLELSEDYLMSFMVLGISKHELYNSLMHCEGELYNRTSPIQASMSLSTVIILNDEIYNKIIDMFMKHTDKNNREMFMKSVVQYSSFFPEIVTEIAGTKWQNSLI